eukprot:TRINITY_DN17714_c0_g1_i1.p2 TRINITY_DN17714_c0_g1~~TRINITY_DN17714_c0_g1_i1.p2  ORF type:complete len:114 (-),score=20.82 TRINITY_DN17714_c0_g1_i1:129-470(-)
MGVLAETIKLEGALAGDSDCILIPGWVATDTERHGCGAGMMLASRLLILFIQLSSSTSNDATLTFRDSHSQQPTCSFVIFKSLKLEATTDLTSVDDSTDDAPPGPILPSCGPS